MAAKTSRNGNAYSLEQAMALLIHNQAQLAGHREEDRQRFVRIEHDLDLIKSMLVRHEEMLQKLPEAIREKIGFKS